MTNQPASIMSISTRSRARVAVCLCLLFAVAGSVSPHKPACADDPLPERKTFVPIDDLDAVLNNDKEGVLLDRQEFTALFNTARANAAKAPRLPATVVVSDASYTARINGDHLLIDATIHFRQFVDGWTQLNFAMSDLSVERATLNGEPARIARLSNRLEGKSPGPQGFDLAVFNETAGPATLELKLSTQLSPVGNDQAAKFRLPDAPAATINVEVAAEKHLQLGSRVLERPTPADQPATYSVPIGGHRNLLLMFTDQQDEQRADTLTFATTAYGVNVAPGEVTWQAKTSLQVFGTTIDRLFCTVPDRLEITGVESTGLESWELADNPDNPQSTLITLNYRQPFDGSRDVVFRGVMATATGEPWAVPQLGVRNVTSHVGRVVVQHPPGVRVRLIEADGARASAGTAGSLLYDIWREDFSLAFETRTKQRDIQSTVSTVLNLKPDGVTFNGRVQLTPYLEPLFEISFRLPADWIVDQISVNGNAVAWQLNSREASWNDYSIPLSTPLPEGQDATFTFRSHRDLEDWPVEEAPAEFTLPVVRLPGSSVVEGTLVVTAGLDLKPVATALRGLDPTVVGETGERLGFAFQSADYEGSLTVTRKPSRISAKTLSFTRLDREVLQTWLQGTLDITGGGLRELKVGLSESAGQNLRFRLLNSPARIVEQTPGSAADGVQSWRLKLDQRIIGAVTIAVQATTPRVEGDAFTAHQLTVPDAERINGFIAIEGAPDQQLKLTALDATGVDLSIVDPIDVPAPLQYRPQQRMVAAYRYTAPGYSITLSETRFDRVAVPTAICYESQLRSILGRTGELQHRAVFQFVAVGAQSLRVQLPVGEQTELWATLIDDQPIEVRSTPLGYLVPIPASSQPDATRKLTLFYRTRVEPLRQTGTIEQQPPLVTVLHSAGEEQRLEMLDQQWKLTYPGGAVLTSSDGDFSPSGELYSYSVLGTLRESFTRLDDRQLTQNGMVALGVLVIVGAIGFVLRRQGVSAVGCLGAGLAGFVLLMALMLPSLEQSRDFASLSEVPESQLAADYGGISTGSAAPSPEFGYIDQSDDGDGEAIPMDVYAGADEEASPMTSADPSAAPRAPAATPEPMAADLALPDEAVIGLDLGAGEVNGVVTNAAPPATTDPFTTRGPESLIDEIEAITEGRGQNMQLQTSRAIQEARSIAANNPAQARQILRRAVAALESAADVDADLKHSLGHRLRIVLGDLEGKEEAFWKQLNEVEQSVVMDGTENWEVLAQIRRGPGRQPEEQAHRDRVRRMDRLTGGLLSLELQLQAPDGSRETDFRYTGNRTAADGTGLRVHWQDQDAGHYGRVFLMAAVALFLWIMLGASVHTRAVLAILGVVLPLSLVSVAPLAMHPVLDGVFLGAVLALSLWLLRTVYRFARKPSMGERIRRLLTSRRSQATAALFLAATLAGVASAADPQPQQPAAEQVAVGQSNRVIVPFDPSGNPLDAERVLLTRDQFLKLWNLAFPDQRIIAKSNRTGVVSDAFYDCRINAENDQAVSVQATLILHSFQSDQIVIPIPLGPVALESAMLDGEPAALEVETGKGANRLIVALDKPGLHTLDLKFDVPAQTSGSVGQFTLPIEGVPAGRAVFRLPETGLSVRVNGSTSAYRLAADGEGESIELPVDGGQALTISWRPPEQIGMVASIVHVDSSTSVVIDDTGVTQHEDINIRVPQGGIADLSFAVPEGLRIQQIRGPHLAGWGFNDVDDQRQLRVFFSPPVTDATQLSVRLFLEQQIDAETEISLPTISPLEVTRETGLIGIVAPDTLSVRSGDISGLIQVNASGNLPLPRVPDNSADQRTPPSPTQARLAWRYTTRPFELNLNVARQQPESSANVQHGAAVFSRKIVVNSFMRATLKGSPRTALAFELGEEFLVLDVDATSLADWYVSESDGVNPRTLTVEFTQPLIGDVDVVVKGQTARNPDPFVLVEFPRPLELSRQTTSSAVWFDPAFEATAVETDGWKAVGPQQIPARLRAFVNRPLQFGYLATDDFASILGFTLQRAVPELTADAVVMVSVADTFLDYTLALKWAIQDAAVDQFTFTTPLWLEDRLNFNGAGIREVLSETDGDSVQWTIHLHNPVRGSYFALAAVTMPPATESVETPSIEFLQPQFDEFGEAMDFVPLETQRLYALLVNQSQAQLVSDHGASIEAVTADEIPIRLAQEILDQAAELLRIRDAGTLPSWGVRRLQQTAGAAASINVADLKLVLAADGSWRCQAIYTVRNRRRQFLAVRLPDDSRLLSLFVRGRPSRPVETQINEQAVQLIPLPRTSDAEGSFQVKLVCTGAFEQPLPGSFITPAKRLELPAPHVVTTAESADFGIPVARTLWTVNVPQDMDASLVKDAMRTNVTETADSEARRAYLKAQLADMAGMLSIVKGKGFSSAQKYEASNNLKQIELAVQNYREELSTSSEDQELQVQLDELQDDIASNESTITRFNSLGVAGDVLTGELETNDPTAQRGQVTRNQFNLILGNSAVSEQTEDLNFNGRLDPGEDFNRNGILDSVSNSVVGSIVLEANNREADAPRQDSGVNAPAAEQDFTNDFKVEIKAGQRGGEARVQNRVKFLEGNSKPQAAPQKKSVTRSERQKVSRDNYSGLNDLAAEKGGSRNSGSQPTNNAFGGNSPDLFGDAPSSGGFGGGGGGGQFTNGRPGGQMQSMGSGYPGGMTPSRVAGERGFATSQQAGGRFGRNDQQSAGTGSGSAATQGLLSQLAEGEETIELYENSGVGDAFVGGVAEWTKVGGLSLPVNIPAPGNELRFSKVGGQPQLTLQIRSREVVSKGVGLVWTAVWIGIGLFLIGAFRRVRCAADLWQPAAWILLAGGLISFLALPDGLSGLGFVCFSSGWLIIIARYVRNGRTSTS